MSKTTTEHLCRQRPDFTEGDDPWAPGKVSSCSYHGYSSSRQKPVKFGKRARRKMDQAAGSLGKDMGTHIRGNE